MVLSVKIENSIKNKCQEGVIFFDVPPKRGYIRGEGVILEGSFNRRFTVRT